jgi:cytochrome c-type biogenesis protein CcmE
MNTSTGTQHPSGVPEGYERPRSRLPLVLAVFVAIAAFGGLTYATFGRAAVYYRTPTEVLAVPGAHVRLSGAVVTGSIHDDIATGVVAFEVTDGRTTVPVRFRGSAPDSLRDGGEAVAEGALLDGTFVADRLFARCPSKFQTQTPGP